MKRRAVDTLLAVAVFALAALAWKAYVEWKDVSPFLLPPPEDVWRATVDLATTGSTWHHVWVTVQEIVGGFALASTVAIAVGFLLAEVRAAERALTPLIVALQVVPKVALIPLLLLWFGFGLGSKLIVAATFAFFPVVAATLNGLKGVPAGHRDVATSLNASRRQRVAMFDLPSALPTILTGLEIAIVLSTVGAIVAEYLAGGEGLGFLAVTSLNHLEVDRLFGAIVLMALVGLVLHRAVVLARRLLVPWHESVRRDVVVPA